MKSLHLYTVCLFSILLSGCNTKTPVSETTEEKHIAVSDSLNSEPPVLQKKELKAGTNVFVITAKGAALYDEPNTETKSIGTISHGTPVKIIAIKDNFAMVNAYIHRVIEDNGKKSEKHSWEDVYTPLHNLGNRNELQILPELLYEALDFENAEEFTSTKKTSSIKQYLNIEIISEKIFNDALKNKSSDFIDHQPVSKKENGKLTLSGDNEPLVLTDNDNIESDYYSINEYIGFIPFLNAYLISETLYEGHSYNMYDKKTAKVINSFYGFPYISPDKRYVITIDFDPYESATEISLYSIKKGKITALEKGTDYMTGFSPYYDEDEKIITRFWSENAFYLKAVQPALALQNGEEHNTPIVPQYLKITFK